MNVKNIKHSHTRQVAVPTMTAQAGRINAAHRKATGAARSMIEWAIEAGNELLSVKESVKHGAFRTWCAENLEFGVRRAQHYMQLAKCEDPFAFAGVSIEAAIRSLQSTRPAAGAVRLTADDAALILKLVAMTNGGNKHEEDVAREKLERMAQRFGMTAGEAGDCAAKFRPDLLPPPPPSGPASAPNPDTIQEDAFSVLYSATRFTVSIDARKRWGTFDREALLEAMIDVITEHRMARWRR